MPKAKTEGAGFLSKSEKAKLQRQVGYPKRKLPTFYTVKIPTQSIVMQHDISKDYQHLLSESMRSGVSI